MNAIYSSCASYMFHSVNTCRSSNSRPTTASLVFITMLPTLPIFNMYILQPTCMFTCCVHHKRHSDGQLYRLETAKNLRGVRLKLHWFDLLWVCCAKNRTNGVWALLSSEIAVHISTQNTRPLQKKLNYKWSCDRRKKTDKMQKATLTWTSGHVT